MVLPGCLPPMPSSLEPSHVPSSPSLWAVGVVACDRLFRFRLSICVLIYIDRLILFILAFFQSAVTCLQWPAEYIIVFGLAEGKVKEGKKPGEVVDGGNGSAKRYMVNLLPEGQVMY